MEQTEQEIIASLEQKVKKLELRLRSVLIDANLNWEALLALADHCQKNGVNPYPNGYRQFNKPIKDLTREEIAQRYKSIAHRHRRIVKSQEALKQPTAEEMEKLYSKAENPLDKLGLIFHAISKGDTLTAQEVIDYNATNMSVDPDKQS